MLSYTGNGGPLLHDDHHYESARRSSSHTIQPNDSEARSITDNERITEAFDGANGTGVASRPESEPVTLFKKPETLDSQESPLRLRQSQMSGDRRDASIFFEPSLQTHSRQIPDQASDSFRRAFRQYRQIAKIRNDVIGTRTTVVEEQRTWSERRDNVEESQVIFMDSLDSHMKRGGSVDFIYLLDLHRQLIADYKELRKQTERLRNLETTLGNAEYRLAKKESQLIVALDDIFSENQIHLNIGSPEDSEQTSSERTSRPPSEVPELLRRYYDKEGDVGILRDRLHDRHAEYQEEVGRREEEAERGKLVEPSDEIFEEIFESDCRALETQVLEVEKLATSLREACISGNLIPSVTPYAPIEDPAGITSAHITLVPPNDTTFANLRNPPFFDRQGPPPRFSGLLQAPTVRSESISASRKGSVLTNLSDTRDRVLTWVRHVPRLARIGSRHQPDWEFEHELSSPASDPDWAYVDRRRQRKSEDAQSLSPLAFRTNSNFERPAVPLSTLVHRQRSRSDPLLFDSSQTNRGSVRERRTEYHAHILQEVTKHLERTQHNATLNDGSLSDDGTQRQEEPGESSVKPNRNMSQ